MAGGGGGDEVDDGDHLLLVPVTASLALGGLDQGVGALQEAGGGSGLVPAGNSLPVGLDHPDEGHEWLQAGAHGPVAPALEVGLWMVNGLLVEAVEVALPAPGAGGGQLGWGPTQPDLLAYLGLGEVDFALEPEVAGSRQLGTVPGLLSARLVHRFVELGHHVAAVVGDLGPGQMLAHPGDKGLGHVAGDRHHLLGGAPVGPCWLRPGPCATRASPSYRPTAPPGPLTLAWIPSTDTAATRLQQPSVPAPVPGRPPPAPGSTTPTRRRLRAVRGSAERSQAGSGSGYGRPSLTTSVPA